MSSSCKRGWWFQMSKRYRQAIPPFRYLAIGRARVKKAYIALSPAYHSWVSLTFGPQPSRSFKWDRMWWTWSADRRIAFCCCVKKVFSNAENGTSPNQYWPVDSVNKILKLFQFDNAMCSHVAMVSKNQNRYVRGYLRKQNNRIPQSGRVRSVYQPVTSNLRVTHCASPAIITHLKLQKCIKSAMH